jgi:hypothetical protein
MRRLVWRLVLPGLFLLLTACQYAGDPTVGAGGFLGDTHSVRLNPNAPRGDAVNLLRAEGANPTVQPLTPEPGDIWPGPVQPEPTLQDIERQTMQEEQTGRVPPAGPQPRGSSSPPPGGPALMPPSAPSPAPPPPALPPNQPQGPSVYQTPQGPAVGQQFGNGVQTYIAPNGGTGIVVPNGNGTSTLIGPNGGVTTVPNPR